MAGRSSSVRPNDGQQPPVSVMIRAMTAPLVEQHESLVAKQGIHFTKSNLRWRTSHLVDEFGSSAHSSSSITPIATGNRLCSQVCSQNVVEPGGRSEIERKFRVFAKRSKPGHPAACLSIKILCKLVRFASKMRVSSENTFDRCEVRPEFRLVPKTLKIDHSGLQRHQ